jgi:hypothetical protein
MAASGKTVDIGPPELRRRGAYYERVEGDNATDFILWQWYGFAN